MNGPGWQYLVTGLTYGALFAIIVLTITDVVWRLMT